MIEQLAMFVEVSETKMAPHDLILEWTHQPGEIAAQAHVAEEVLQRVMPDWLRIVPDDEYGKWEQLREACIRAQTQLLRADELEEYLGEIAPDLNAARMHPWVWEGARSLWQSRHYAEAVRSASVKVNAETQNKIGRRDIGETDLFNQAFSDDAATAKGPRLRLSGASDDSKTAKSMRRGMRSFAEGCYAAIRNPLSHEVSNEMSED